jgi:hypothetical protein
MKHYSKTARAAHGNHTNAAQLKNTNPQQHGSDFLISFSSAKIHQKTQTAIYFFITHDKCLSKSICKLNK